LLVLCKHCVFHEEPAVALPRFFFAITRYLFLPGVFVGLFGGQRVGHFFLGGGHFGEIGSFYAHFSPGASKRDLGVTYLRGHSSGARGVDRRRHYDATLTRGGWWRGAVRPLIMRQGGAISCRLGPPFELPITYKHTLRCVCEHRAGTGTPGIPNARHTQAPLTLNINW
jgi:hypothetical protein